MLQSNPSLLHGPRVYFRALEPSDVDTLYEWENDPEVWGVGSTLAPYSQAQLLEYASTYDADIYAAKQLRLMIVLKDGDVTIGTADLFDFDPANSRSAVGILIAPDYRNQGLATEALNLLGDYCRTVYSLHQLYAIVGAYNPLSRKLFEKCGYSCSGRLQSWIRQGGSYSDAYFYQRML